jgi:DNA repair protein RadA/Sms
MASLYRCRGCNAEPRSEPWRGRCPACRAFWDCVRVNRADSSTEGTLAAAAGYKAPPRISTKIAEVDRVLGGGLVVGSTMVITGAAGCGKSTLILQLADGVAANGSKVLYTNGEQNKDDVLGLAARLGMKSAAVKVMAIEGDVYKITAEAEQFKPALLVIDSLQTAFIDDCGGDEGSTEQCKAVANYLTAWGKREKVAILIIAHVNQDGNMAGPMSAQHLVDGILYFDPFVDEESPEDENLRVLSSGKNRNGPSGIREFFRMTSSGLVPTRKKSTLEIVR